MNYPHLLTDIQGPVARLWLNRPESRNALHREMIREITAFLQEVKNMPQVRIVVLGGSGTAFSAGADLNWMKSATTLSQTENRQDAIDLARCLYELAFLPKITIARIQGAAYGGALGLMAACDMAIISKSCSLAFSEVKLGLIPATIAPYVLRKANAGITEFLLTGRQFDGNTAVTLHMAGQAVEEDELDSRIDSLVAELLQAAPEAQLKIKGLINQFGRELQDESVVFHTASLLAETRVSDEAREGLTAFLEKRQPAWVVNHNPEADGR